LPTGFTGWARDNWGDIDYLKDIEGVEGSDWDDVLIGSDADNRLDGREGADTLDGAGGSDLVEYNHAEAGVVVDLSARLASNDGSGFVDVLRNIENVQGSIFADRIAGDSGANRLDGDAGNDTLTGGAGNDRFYFRAGLRSTESSVAIAETDLVTDFSVGDRLVFDGALTLVTGIASALTAGQVRIEAITQTGAVSGGFSGARVLVGRDTVAGADLIIQLPGVDANRLVLDSDAKSIGLPPPDGKPMGIDGSAYHWKSHALLSGVTASVGDQKAVEASNDLFDLRATSFDAATGMLTVQLWANPTQASSTFDVTAITQGASSASFTSSLSSASWTVLPNTNNPDELSIAGYLSNPAASGVTGAIQLGTLSLTLPPNAPIAVRFKDLVIGNSTAPEATLALASSVTGIDGKYSLALADGSYSLTVTRAVGDGSTNHGITSADALAALKIAVGINPNTDPDGTGPLQTPMLSPYQVMAADVNRDGKVTSADALAILKMSVKLSDAPTPAWMFVEEKRDFWDEATKAFTLTRNAASWDTSINLALPSAASTNLVGVLKGDVNGSWTLPGATTIEATNPTYFKDLAQLIGVPADQWGIPPGG